MDNFTIYTMISKINDDIVMHAIHNHKQCHVRSRTHTRMLQVYIYIMYSSTYEVDRDNVHVIYTQYLHCSVWAKQRLI